MTKKQAKTPWFS